MSEKKDNRPKDGTAYVAEYLNHRVQVLNSHNVKLGIIGSRGSGENQFEYPEDVALDSEDYLYVLDSGNHRVCKFDHDHKQVATLGKHGTEEGEFSSPRTIIIDSGMIYVSDSMNHRIQLFNSSTHHLIVALGEKGDGELQFNIPHGLALDAHKNLFIADSMNHRIKVFDQSQMPIGSLGSEGYQEKQFVEPSGVFVDTPAGEDDDSQPQRLYVSERGNHRIQIFSIVLKPREEPKTDEEAHLLMVKRRQQMQAALAGDEVEWERFVEFEPLFVLGHEGTLSGQFKFPMKICQKSLSTTIQLYIADSVNDRLQVVNPNNNWEHLFNVGERENKIKPKNPKKAAKIPVHRRPVFLSCPTGIAIVGGMWCEDPPALRGLDVEHDEDDDGLGEDIIKLGIGDEDGE